MTAKKCTNKVFARAELLFYLLFVAIAFLTSPLPSPSSHQKDPYDTFKEKKKKKRKKIKVKEKKERNLKERKGKKIEMLRFTFSV